MTSFNANLPPKAEFVRPQQAGFLADIKVAWKLALIITVLILGTLGIFLSAISGMQTLNNQISNIYTDKLIPIASIGQAETTLVDIQDQLRLLHNARLTPEQQSAAFQTITDSEKSFEQIITRYESEWITTRNADFTRQLRDSGRMDLQSEETATLANLRNIYENYLENRKKFQSFQEKGLYDAKSEDTALAGIAETRSHLRHLVIVNTQFAELSNIAAGRAYQQAVFAMSGTLILAILLGLFLAFVIGRSITDRLGKMTLAAQALEQGVYQKNAAKLVRGLDEIGEVASAFDSMADQMTQALSGLEQRVLSRTAELQGSTALLEKRAVELEAVSEISNSIATIQDIHELLPRVVKIISERFGFYHVGIFLFSETRDYLILSAASSEGGQRLVEKQYKLLVDPNSLCGFAASRGRPRISQNVEEDTTYLAVPEFSETKSEVALPLMAGTQVIGVLDVQSAHKNVFTGQNINILTTLTNQVAISIQNARSFSETNRALAESDKIYQRFVRQGWKQISSELPNKGYKYTSQGTTLIANSADISTKNNDDIKIQSSFITIPIKLSGQTIGAIRVRSTEAAREWSSDELALIQAATDRASLALENARLLEDSQRRASKERVIGEISSKISAAANTDNILKTAVSELGSIIPDTEIIIQFVSGQDTTRQENTEVL